MKPVSSNLQRILDDTRAETRWAASRESVKRLRQLIKNAPPVNSFRRALTGGPGIIAEIKRRSPSQGDMLKTNVDQAPFAYRACREVKAVSVLTNQKHFGMGVKDLLDIREKVHKPVLRKEFIVEEYQVLQARAYGADAILLMANILEPAELERLSSLASELELDVLYETHVPEELSELPKSAALIGINCRHFDSSRIGLRSFGLSRLMKRLGFKRDRSTDIARFAYVNALPPDAVKIAESGIGVGNCAQVLAMGFDTLLVGTSFLTDPRGIEPALADFTEAMGAGTPELRKGSLGAAPAS